MSVAVDVERSGVTIPLAVDRVRDAVRAACRQQRVRDAMISVTFLSDAAMARMNRDYLDHRGATDVITFELKHMPGAIVGDIYIAPNVVRRNAREHGVGVREELLRVVVHGTLHVLGHTHPESDARTRSPMWRTQERILRRLMTARAALRIAR